MAQLIPVDHDPFDMADSLAAASGDSLVPPPRNPMAPPQGLVDALSGAVKKNLDWASVPGRVARGVEPETPGQWSEEDEFRRQHLASSPYEWGPQTAFGEVFWPRTGTNVGGSGFNVGSGAIIPPKQGIRAYHGSPHDFDRFDLSKIGTGEGAQSYGHGLYFAENPTVAESYKTAGVNNNSKSAAESLAIAGLSRGQSAADFRKLAASQRALGESGEAFDHAAHLIETQAVKRPRMYEVNINAKPEQFLDWDRPLAGQATEPLLRDLARDRSVEGSKLTGGEAYQRLTNRYIDPTPVPISQIKSVREGTQERATSMLREAGIPGIKYLDQWSRGAGSGSSNYVVFDDKIIDILHKYGVGGLSMLPPAIAAHIQSRLIPVDHDPFAQ